MRRCITLQIREIRIQRFRCLESLVWQPAPGINCLIGPGDSGKSSVLDAVAVALAPAPAGPASENDYFLRRVEDGFEIELVVGNLSEALQRQFVPAPLWGWAEGRPVEDAPVEGTEPVLRIVARGTPDLDIEHRLIRPNGEDSPLAVPARRAFGLCLFGSGRGAAREFRMSRGSLLERVIGREELRGAAAQAVRDAGRAIEIPERIAEDIRDLRARFDYAGVPPGDLALGFLAPPGQNLLGFLGLVIGDGHGAIPLGFHGQGTQQVAMFQLALRLAAGAPIAVLDEVEIGLEPYRQRQLMSRLREVVGETGQAFITTHSPTVLSERDVTETQRVDRRPADAQPGDGERDLTALVIRRLESPLARIKKEDPEALLSRLPIVCEGHTEIGLLSVLLERSAAQAGSSLSARGVRLVDGGGQPNALGAIQSLLDARFDVAAYLDDEEKHSGKRLELLQRGALLSSGACIEFVLAEHLPLTVLDALLDVRGRYEGAALPRRVYLQQVNEGLGTTGERDLAALIDEYGETAVRDSVGTTAHRNGWFKTADSGKRLGGFLIEHGLPTPLEERIAGFWQGVASLLD